MEGQGERRREANPRLLASIRVGVGVIALLKAAGSALLDAPHPGVTTAWMILSVALVSGWWARWAAAALFMVGAYSLSLGAAQSDLYLLVLVLPVVALSGSERRYSVRSRGSGSAAAWPLVVMRVQLSIAYLFFGIAPMPSSLGIAAEVFVGLGVWSRRLRELAFALVLPLHITVLAMSNSRFDWAWLGPFSLLVLVLSASFLDVPERGRVVVWDDGCSFCRRWISVLRWFDIFGSMRFVGLSRPEEYANVGVRREAATEALQLVEPDGRIRSGYAAVRGIVSVLPGGWFIALYMSLPGLPTVGSRVYRRVAARRTCSYVPAGVTDDPPVPGDVDQGS